MNKMTVFDSLYQDGKEYNVHHFEYRNRKLNHWCIDISDRPNGYISLSESELQLAIKTIQDAKRGKLLVERVD